MSKRSRADWRGYIPAITTPFDAERNLDLTALGGLLEWLHGEGMHGLLIAGTTGEWPSLSDAERAQLFAAAGAQLAGKLPLLAGCTAYTPRQVLAHAQHAAASGLPLRGALRGWSARPQLAPRPRAGRRGRRAAQRRSPRRG